MPTFPAWIAAVVACLLLPAETWTDAERHFTLEVPEGWRPMTAEELQRVNDAIPEAARSQVAYTAAFRPVGDMPGGYPYVLVQPTSWGAENPSWEDIEEALRSETVQEKIEEFEGTLGSLLKGSRHDAATLDRTRNLFVKRVSLELDGTGTVEGLTVGHLGRRLAVHVHGYALRDDFEATLPVFERLNESFRWEPGHEYQPGPSRWERVGRKALIGGIIGLLAGLVIRALRKRK